jgi:hypothetical protein
MVGLALFALYFIYGLFHIPFTQYLVSMAVGGIAFGYTESYELAAIALFVMHFLYRFLGGPVVMKEKEGFMATNPQEISGRIQSIQKGTYGMPVQDVKGVGSKLSEGFEDASGADMTLNKNSESSNSSNVSASSKPASTGTTSVTESKESEAKPTQLSDSGVPPANQPQTAPLQTPEKKTTQGFQDNGSLFKLGQIPTNEKGGFHLDAGTTVMNALSALKPDQIKAMTQDTRSLIETQKSLMGMLQQFQPMMSEGKQMMQTFQQMFAPTAGAS